MGRVKSNYVKTSAEKTFELGKEEFTENFAKNNKHLFLKVSL
jgi:ribosomal protein S17E